MSQPEIEQPSLSNYTLSLMGAIGSLLLFALIMLITYLPNRPKAIEEQTAEERKAILSTLQAESGKLADSYGWIDQKNGVVRIPIEQAQELIVERLNADR